MVKKTNNRPTPTMSPLWSLLSKCAVLLQLLVLVRGDFIFNLKFQSYTNPRSFDSNGDNCDPSGFRSCENKFEFCLREAGHSHDDLSHCPYGRFESGEVGGDNIDLSSSDSIGNLPNPLLFENSGKWMGFFQLAIVVIDIDFGADDLIDRFFIEEELAPNEEVTSTYTGVFSNGHITLSLSVVCTEYYYTTDCSLYCVARDDMLGHYTCDENGGKVCLQGYTEPETSCIKRYNCVLTCSPDGGTCSQSGSCVCEDGWSGVNCDVAVCSPECVPGNGQCVAPNNCSCDPGWTGSQCETCIPADGCYLMSCENLKPCQNSGTCEGENYTCTCSSGWTGLNCELPSCQAGPCQNGGNCTTHADFGYVCTCPEGFSGQNCSVFPRGGKFEAIYAGAGVGAFVIAIILLLLLGIAVLICKQCHNKQELAISRACEESVYTTVTPQSANKEKDSESSFISPYAEASDNPLYAEPSAVVPVPVPTATSDNGSGSVASTYKKFENPVYGSSEDVSLPMNRETVTSSASYKKLENPLYESNTGLDSAFEQAPNPLYGL